MDLRTPIKYKRLLWKVRNNTMVNYPRLVNILSTADEIATNNVLGNYVECGVWKGGCSALFAYKAQQENKNRIAYLFDSFEGLPEPTIEDGQGAYAFAEGKSTGKLNSINKNVGTQDEVQRLFVSLNLTNYKIIKGWFQITLPEYKHTLESIAVLRLDGDWYESTKVCLENLYDKVSVGGYILIDDYNFWPGCKKAVDEFYASRNITPEIKAIDSSGISIRKE
jgi:hypothetical protein